MAGGRPGAAAARSGLAGGPGFEPGLLGPEPRVLPLNYPPRTARRGIGRGLGLVKQPAGRVPASPGLPGPDQRLGVGEASGAIGGKIPLEPPAFDLGQDVPDLWSGRQALRQQVVAAERQPGRVPPRQLGKRGAGIAAGLGRREPGQIGIELEGRDDRAPAGSPPRSPRAPAGRLQSWLRAWPHCDWKSASTRPRSGPGPDRRAAGGAGRRAAAEDRHPARAPAGAPDARARPVPE